MNVRLFRYVFNVCMRPIQKEKLKAFGTRLYGFKVNWREELLSDMLKMHFSLWMIFVECCVDFKLLTFKGAHDVIREA
jgi:hypothetical protein